MKQKIIYFISIIILILICGLAILQYFWLEKVRVTEFFRMKRELYHDSSNIIYKINYDFFNIYKKFKPYLQISLNNISEKEKIDLNNLINDEKLISFILNVYSDNEIYKSELIDNNVNNDILENVFNELNFINELDDKYNIKFLYYISFKNYPLIIIPTYSNNKKISDALVLSINKNYLYDSYLPSLIRNSFKSNNISDYIIEIDDINKPGNPLVILNQKKSRRHQNADIIYPLFLNFTQEELSENDFQLYENLKKQNKNIYTISENRNFIKELFDDHEKNINQSESNFLLLLKELINEELKFDKKYGFQVFVFSIDLNQISIKITHKSGSINNAALIKQIRNIIISFSILFILSLTMIILFSAYKNIHKLKAKELEFITSITHELCTPIAVINSAGENLKAGFIKNNEKISEYGNLISEESNRLKEMVEKILIYSGLKKIKYSKISKPINIEKMIDNILDKYKIVFNKYNFILDIKIEKNLPQIKINENDFYSIIQNLISNVIKHSNEGKYLGINVLTNIKNSKNYIKIEITDKGKGISKKDLKKIFDAFYRTKKTINDQIPGSGFGLFLTKKIIKLYNGNIKVVSYPEKGTKFIILLPS